MERRDINRHMRQMLDLKQSDLADMLHVSRQSINNYEKGKCHSDTLENDIETRLNALGAIGGFNRDDTVKLCCTALKVKRDALLKSRQ